METKAGCRSAAQPQCPPCLLYTSRCVEETGVILNGLGKDAAQIISRINGFTYVKTDYDFATGELKVVETIPYSEDVYKRQTLNGLGSSLRLAA